MAYTIHNQNQKHFAVSELAVDWHNLLVLQCSMPPSTDHCQCQCTTGPTLQPADISLPQSAIQITFTT